MKKNVFASLAAALLLHGPLSFAAGTDDLLEVTTKIEMPGMTMPAQTNQVCSPKGKANESMVPQEGDCKMTDLKRSGNKTTFKMVCNNPEPMTGTGEFVTDSPTAYHGKMRMSGKVEGEPMDMTTTYSSKRIGSCTYEDQGKKAKEQVEINNAAACRDRMDAMEWQIYFGEYAVEFCKPYRKEFCGRVSKRAEIMRDPANYADPKNKKWKEAAEACGQNTEAVLKEACGRAPGANNWQFVADNCPAEAKQAAAQYCEGRSYTARMSSPYGPVCAKYASEPGTGTAQMGSAGLPTVDSIKNDGAGAALEKGAKALKGLLNF